jgi:predicted SAM-dependent methyltransferase
VDIIAEAISLPFEIGEVKEIVSAHLVEHFSAQLLERTILPYWHELLEPGGNLTTIAPDGAAMLEAFNKGRMTFEDFREVLFGAQEYEGDYHFNLLTPKTMHDVLRRIGFVDVETVYEGRPNGKCLEFSVSAKKSLQTRSFVFLHHNQYGQ